jgi:(p)ppGpp synthase/HD superfamily hydrolase
VVQKDFQLIEVQIQTKEMLQIEQSNREANHATYKERQMGQRRKLGKEYVALYKALSELFTTPEQNYCSIEYIEIGQVSKGLDDEF